MRKNLRLEYALAYARRGWAVLPLHSAWIPKGHKDLRCSCVKGFNCKAKGKHPRIHTGSRGASRDPEEIKTWWEEWPLANIGVATGEISDFWVIDIDFKQQNGWESLTNHYGTLPIDKDTELIQQTTTGGFHILVEWDSVYKPMNKTAVFPGVDIRSDGGYIVVAPSTIGPADYQWNNLDNQPAPFKEWTLDISQRSQVAVSKLDKGDGPALDLEITYQQGIPEGERDDTLVRIAGKMLHANVPYEIAQFVMVRMGERCIPFDAEIQEKLTSVLEYVYEHYPSAEQLKKRKRNEELLTGNEMMENKFIETILKE